MTAGRAAEPPSATAPLQSLWSAAPSGGPGRGAPMPRALRTRYGGPLEITLRPDRPTMLVNFVSTLDGVVALGSGPLAGGGPISGNNEPDRFVMGLLRAVADVLLVGAGTIAGTSRVQWSADHVHPESAGAFARWRRSLGLAPQPTTVIATRSGDVRLGARGLADPVVPVVFATTGPGARRLAKAGLPGDVSVEVAGSGPELTAADLEALLIRLGARVVLSEGGPHLYGELLAADLVDELFLTVSPQLVGRAGADAGDRLGMVEGVALPAAARWHQLVSVKRDADHLFLRYRRHASG